MRVVQAVIVWLMLGLIAVAVADADTVNASTSELVAKLQGPLGMYGNDFELGGALAALGDAALPAIEQGITQGDPRANARLLLWVMGIPGERATSMLLRVMAESQEPSLRSAAIRCLAERQVAMPLTAEELDALRRAIAEGNGWSAGEASRALARCEVLSADERVPPILARFQAEVMTPAQPRDRSGDSYLSPHVRRLNVYLRAFSYAGEVAVPYVRQAVKDAASGDVRKWLTIASGMAGDGRAADDLERMVRDDLDTSARVEDANSNGIFDPPTDPSDWQDKNTYYVNIEDEELLCLDAEFTWSVGCCDSQDWANPGHQY